MNTVKEERLRVLLALDVLTPAEETEKAALVEEKKVEEAKA